MNDTVIIGTISLIFILIGAALPFVQDTFNEDVTTYNTDSITDGLTQETIEQTSITNVFDVLGSILKMFFWTFGDLPIWLDLIFSVFRIILVFIVIRNFVPTLGSGS